MPPRVGADAGLEPGLLLVPLLGPGLLLGLGPGLLLGLGLGLGLGLQLRAGQGVHLPREEEDPGLDPR